MSNDIRNLLQIKDPNILFEENCVEKVNQTIYSHCYLSYPIDYCSCCETKDTMVKNGTRTSRITYLDVCGQPCYLLMKKQRYRCKACHQCLTVKTSLVERHWEENCTIEQRLFAYRPKSHWYLRPDPPKTSNLVAWTSLFW